MLCVTFVTVTKTKDAWINIPIFKFHCFKEAYIPYLCLIVMGEPKLVSSLKGAFKYYVILSGGGGE